MVSVDFAEIEQYQFDSGWNTFDLILEDAAKQLVMVGTDCVAICANTMQIVFD